MKRRSRKSAGFCNDSVVAVGNIKKKKSSISGVWAPILSLTWDLLLESKSISAFFVQII